MKQLNARSGFTMIELLVVIAVIAVLASVALGGSYMQSRKAAKDAKRKSDISSLQISLESYYADKKQYPSNANATGMISNLVAQGYISNPNQFDDALKSGYTYKRTSLHAYELCTPLEVIKNGVAKFCVYNP